ncbi:hypothetical protein MNBD_GAMMA06-1171 [hydrothermal vent metagenome]|uniref:Uncharacterized protein n=1 Tax=hydrothermal vent metagenome TaxID=652676 RepID=A0A3B0X9L6_9ZZZZ
MNSVRLYYIKHQGEDDLAQINALLIEQWLAALSAEKQAAVQQLLHYNNRVTSLLGLYLLNRCASDEGVSNFKLCDVQYPDTGKPFWQQGNFFYDFNISHSANFIIVAASTTLKVGIDVEQIKILKNLNFKRIMSADELAKIQKTPSSFFDLWTKKEAVVKAANTTGLARMGAVELKQDSATLDGEEWHLKKINLDDEYVINLASAELVDELIVKKITLAQLPS